ncbi:MAG TPA: class I SAM-dependent methyltransferase [Rhizomicrobium sp.]|nr:class I SAM-dependent methyltransferase [Rhizomicrobium sp.]
MTTASAADIPAYIRAALADPARPAEQRARDRNRKPGDVIAFSGLKPGDRVADLLPESGYFTRIFSRVVGSSGRVYAFTPTEELKNCSAHETAGIRAMAHDPRYRNVDYVWSPAEAFFPPVPLDLVWTSQNYHDLHDKFMGPANVELMNAEVFEALKPGGVYLVIDHAAQAGSGLRDTETLHRIDPETIKREVEAAGFVFEGESAVLRNPADDHTKRVFDPAIRGRTDQVVLKFRKPAE